MAQNGTDGLVNHTLKNLIQGVSEQTLESRLESQVDEMENCIPHLSRGILRRNPLQFINYTLKDGTNILPADYFVYSYDRGTTDEQYLMFIGNLKWYIFNANTGILVGDYITDNSNTTYLNTNGLHPKDVFSLVTVGDYTWINNNQVTTGMTNSVADGGNKDLHKETGIYWCKKVLNSVISTNQTTGAATTQGLTYTLKIGGASTKVINGSSNPFIYQDEQKFQALNKTYQIAGAMYYKLSEGNSDGGFTYNYETKYVYGTKKDYHFFDDGNGNIGKQWDGKWVQDSVDITYTKGELKFTDAYYNDFYEITKRTKVYNNVDGGGVWKNYQEFTYNSGLNSTDDFSMTDGNGGEAAIFIKGSVRKSSDLPANLPSSIGPVIIKIDSNTDVETGSEYWMRWNEEFWEETIAPGLNNEIEPTTMPHVFIRNADKTFSFGYYGEKETGGSAWLDRLKGDESTAPEPSFIGKKISSIFFHNNRLGILSEDNIVMSELSVYKNFWPTTIRTIPDTDPIDITAATRDVTGLKTAVSVSGSLLLFSDTNQFILTSTGGALTPESAVINNVSSYNYNPLAPATVIGNKVFFTSESGNGTQMFDFTLNSILTTGSENVAANNLSLHIPTYLPKNIKTILGHSILGYVFIHSYDDPKTIYVLNTITVDAQSAQQAFHKWTFKEDIIDIGIIKNDLNIVFKSSTEMRIAKMSLDIPADINEINYSDEYNTIDRDTFNSEIRLSKWQIKDGNGFGTMRGRLQIRTAQFAVKKSSKYDIKLINESLLIKDTSDWILADSIWNDLNHWNDTSKWSDGNTYKERIYKNDTKVSVLSNAAETFIIFKNSEDNKTAGFELSTINFEGMFRQRSQRF